MPKNKVNEPVCTRSDAKEQSEMNPTYKVTRSLKFCYEDLRRRWSKRPAKEMENFPEAQHDVVAAGPEVQHDDVAAESKVQIPTPMIKVSRGTNPTTILQSFPMLPRSSSRWYSSATMLQLRFKMD